MSDINQCQYYSYNMYESIWVIFCVFILNWTMIIMNLLTMIFLFRKKCSNKRLNWTYYKIDWIFTQISDIIWWLRNIFLPHFYVFLLLINLYLEIMHDIKCPIKFLQTGLFSTENLAYGTLTKSIWYLKDITISLS